MAENLVMGRRTFIKGSLAASALAALAACGKNEGSGATKVMKYYINEPVSIDPYNLQESEGTAVGHLLFRSLYSWDWDKGEAVPCAAKDVKISDDGKVYTFELVDAKFHNGDKVDAESFKRGWQRLADPTMATPGDIGYHLAPVAGYDEFVAKKAKEISGLVAVDDTHFEVTLTAPMADFLAVCCHPGLAPVPQAAIDDPDAFLLAPIGNGPFMMDGKWESGKHINMKRFEDYFGEAPKIDAVNFSIQKDPKTAYSEFEAGNMDFCMVPTGQLSEAKKKYGESEDGYTITPGKQVITGAEASVYYLVPNLENKVMGNKDLRHAISLAIDRQNIVDTLFEGSRTPADCIFPPVIDQDDSNIWEYAPAKPDYERAKKIIKDAGLEGTEITLNYNSGGGHEDIMSIIQGDLEKIGLKVKQSAEEWASYLSHLDDGSFMLGRMGWVADYPTMDNFIYPNFFSTADNNYQHYKNADVDKAILEARQIQDDDERRDAYRKINATLAEDLPVIPIMFYGHDHIGSERVSTLYVDPQYVAHVDTADMTA